jgi:hypothetical protein
MTPLPLSLLVRTALVTAVVDGLFSSVLSAFFYDSTVARLWQGVASVLLGPDALEGGMRTVAVGLVMHLCVAFTWSTVFLVLAGRSAWIRALLSGRYGPVKVAAVYGPFVWLMMSLVVIPTLTQRPPSFTYRWWIQLVGHFPFVGLPIVATIAGGLRRSASTVAARTIVQTQ